jgi:poly(A) polymerase
MSHSLKGSAAWLDDPLVGALFAVLNTGGEARIVGGAVRNTLLGKPAGDLDFATTHLPDATMTLVAAAGFKPVPTGYAHGTITAVKEGRGFEITTLRRDVSTDGRHAEVAFGVDWAADARRRDFTINAMSCDADGALHDYCGGLADLEKGVIRFIGDAEARINEDQLRGMRFYRFFAWYGTGRPDADGIRATAKLKSGLSRLSAERVWQELRKLLLAPDPARALLWMRQSGVLTEVLPESAKWGIDAVPGLVAAEQSLGWRPDALLRLAAITPPDQDRVSAMAARLKFSNAERDRVLAHARAAPAGPELSDAALRKRLYREGASGLTDRLRLALAASRAKAAESDAAMLEAAHRTRQLGITEAWVRPVFPVGGGELKERTGLDGPALGAALSALETRWVDSGFTLTREQLLA